jgi:imidazolonepropionase
MLIHSASQLITLEGGPQRGSRLGKLGIIKNGAALIRNGFIEEVGTTETLLIKYPDEERYDAKNRVVMPGFVDPHTHAVWAGDRANEFEAKLAGKTYLEILAEGGGILSTVSATRNASLDELKMQSKERLMTMFKHGVTTIEVKTGYGLDLETELKQLRAILDLDEEGPFDLIPTFLGAHAVPQEYENDPDGYVDLLCNSMLPEVLKWWDENANGRGLPFVDVFCETGAFSLEQSRKIMSSAKELGFPLKIHVDEFDNLGGASMAVEMGAISADHIVKTSIKDIETMATSDVVGVSLPGTPFGLAHKDYSPVKSMIENDGFLAIASDLNPGTTWCENPQMIIAIACRYMKLTPAQAIAAYTINAAKAIGKHGEIGSLEPGKKADLLVLSVSNYQQLGYRYGTNLVDIVIKDGNFNSIK